MDFPHGLLTVVEKEPAQNFRIEEHILSHPEACKDQERKVHQRAVN